MYKNEIVNYLKNKYLAKGIILYGSRALGVESRGGDWDIFIFSDKPKEEIEGFGELDEYLGQQIDLSVYPTNVPENFILSTAMHPVSGAVVLYDDLGGKMSRLVDGSNNLFNKGPDKITKEQKSLQRKILRKFMNKARPSVS